MNEWPSAKANHALLACVVLARRAPDEFVSLDEIASEAGLPRPFLATIFGHLRRGGIVAARRGSHGGYQLARNPEDISLQSILCAVGNDFPLRNGFGRSDGLPLLDVIERQLFDRWTEVIVPWTLHDLAHVEA